ncbi:MAG: DUF2029 domain-containing protein [Planctomycetes bacterium]|nr:DUF2029 domain-containing protein [Planctomycetota bacterium]
MGGRSTLLIGASIVAAALAVVLATHEAGLGKGPDGAYAWPNLLEDASDRFAYLQRGRWIASGGTPYLDEFSEYPQLATWLMALPYLFFDHDVRPGEPFTAERRVREIVRRAGRPEEEAERLFKEFYRRPLPAAAVPEANPAWHDEARALAAASGVAEAEVQAVLARAWREIRIKLDELLANRGAYEDIHQGFMALFLLALLVATVANLRALGRAPGFALLLFLPASLYFSFSRFDPVVTFLVALALLCHLRERPRLAALVLGLAVMTKWYPIVLAPLFFSHDLRRAREQARRAAAQTARFGPLFWQHVLAPGLILCAVIAAVLSITWIWHGGGADAVTFVFRWHAETRQPNKSSLLLLLTSPERWGWFAPTARDALEAVFKVLQLAPGFLLALLPIRTARSLLLSCLAATLCVVTFSEFFSPQWVIWITALALLLAPDHKTLLVLLLALEAATYLQFPLLHGHAVAGGDFAGFWLVNGLRASLLLAFLAASLVALFRSLASPRPTPRGGVLTSAA